MPKGGARVRSGPPPDPNALSRDSSDWVMLPAAGRPGDPPQWPLPDQDPREAELWARHWAMPQAIVWDAQSQHYEVALYVRRLVEVEKPDAPVALGTLVRQLADNLGLTTPGMLRNRWRIAAPDVTEPTVKPRAAAGRAKSARDRFRVVNGDGA